MSLPEHTVIRAIIPHSENPDTYIRDKNGNYPHAIHERGTGTYEETLRKIGREVLGCNLSVDMRVPDTPGEITYQTKKVTECPPPESPFQWQYTPNTP